MKYLQSILLVLLSYFWLFVFTDVELANSSFSAYENQIFEWSSEKKVRKLQEVFYQLWLYSWVVDWNYDSIRSEFIQYQINAWVISWYDDSWAWYFGVKTITALERDYGSKFLLLKDEYLRVDEPSLDERYFYVTAYYTPVAWQKRYTTWSFAWDLRLNTAWDPTITASWKKVAAWLMAAPRNYSFWTKIYLEWIGIWSVEDRWWAIVNAWERGHDYDRIDIWMWYWDEWLERALRWWTRKVRWNIVDSNSKVTVEFENEPIEQYAKLQVSPDEDEANSVVELQKLLKEIWLYNWVIDWNYARIKNILIKYQIEKWIIDTEYESAAWFFWPKTFAAIREEYWSSNWFFKEKYFDWDNDNEEEKNNIDLTYSKSAKLDALKKKLDVILERKYSWDLYEINRFKNKLRSSLNQVINKWISQNKKTELLYFKNIL